MTFIIVYIKDFVANNVTPFAVTVPFPNMD